MIRKRLFLLGDFTGDTLETKYNNELVDAVKNFQERSGLYKSGVINQQTLKELNKPLRDYITQILVNMERTRWLPLENKGTYLGVNIPEFKLHVYQADSLLWSCNVVVGEEMNRTTVFYGEMKYVVFSPYWNIPPSIVKNEIVPGMKKMQAIFNRTAWK